MNAAAPRPNGAEPAPRYGANLRLSRALRRSAGNAAFVAHLGKARVAEAAVGVAFAILILIAIASYFSIAGFLHRAALVGRGHEVQTGISEIGALRARAIVGWRGFLATGDPEALTAARGALAELLAAFDAMRGLAVDPTQRQRLDELEALVLAERDALETSLARKIAGEFDTAERTLAELADPKANLPAISALIARIAREQAGLLAARRQQSESAATLMKRLIVAGNVVGLLLLGMVFVMLRREIAERQAAEREARRASAEVEDLYNRAPCGYHSIDADGVVVRMNDTELGWLGYARDEVIGKMNISGVLAPEYAAGFGERFARFRQSGESYESEVEHVRKDGTRCPVIVTTSAVRDAQGSFVMSRASVYDNTQRKRAEQAIKELNARLEAYVAQLVAANKELESFSYSVSHDLRAPVRAIDGYSRILEEDYGAVLDAEGRRLLGVVRESTRRMGALIDDLLLFSRLARGPLSSAPIDMTDLVREVLEEQVPREHADRWTVRLAELPQASGDAALLRQVWTNLVGNAVKYSSKRERPEIEITGRANADAVEYCVRDNGVGFDMAYRDKLFGVFQRLHSDDEFPGTGVGLAIVQRVVARHGGRVWAEGRPNAGASFFFSLPVREARDD